jgi:hypothetical protein
MHDGRIRQGHRDRALWLQTVVIGGGALKAVGGAQAAAQ